MTLKSQCALKGASVVLKCEYDYPGGSVVTSVGWYKVRYVSGTGRLYPVTNPPSSPNHFRYAGKYGVTAVWRSMMYNTLMKDSTILDLRQCSADG